MILYLVLSQFVDLLKLELNNYKTMNLKLPLIFTILFLIIEIILLLNGVLTFGYGLGDLFYLFVDIFFIVILIVCLLIIIIKKIQLKTITRLIFYSIIFLFLAYNIYSFTIGRGVESPWNGKVFILK